MWVQVVGLVVQVVPAFILFCGGGGGVHWVQVVRASGVLRCVPSLCPCLLSALLLCLWWVACKYGSISHFKAVYLGL